MPSYEYCEKLVNPQGLNPEALSYSEKIFLEFCKLFEYYPEELKEVVKTW